MTKNSASQKTSAPTAPPAQAELPGAPACTCEELTADWPPEERLTAAGAAETGIHAQGCALFGAATVEAAEAKRKAAAVQKAPAVVAGPMRGVPTPATVKKAPAAAPAIAGPEIVTGRQDAAPRIFLYGDEGAGKTTLASHIPDVIFDPVEDGAGQVEAPKFKPSRTWDDHVQKILWLAKADHPYKALAVDTVDALEGLLQAKVLDDYNANPEKGKATAFGRIPYKAGYELLLEEWTRHLRRMDKLRERGILVVLIGHATIRKASNPEGEDYDHIEPRLYQKSAALIRGWCDAMLYATFTKRVSKASKWAKAKAFGTGAPELRTRHTAAFDAKNRYGLPDRLAMEWDAVAHHLELWRQPVQLRQAIDELVEALGDHTVAIRGRGDVPISQVVAEELATNPPAEKLARLRNRLEAVAEEIEEKAAATAEANAGPLEDIT